MLAFTAPHGVVALPPDTAACLADNDATAEASSSSSAPAAPPPSAPYSGPLRVRYTRLPKGTFASLQPLRAAFQRDVADVKAALEAALAQRCTLTVGDVIVASDAAGNAHAVRVRALLPEDAVSVIETGASNDDDGGDRAARLHRIANSRENRTACSC